LMGSGATESSATGKLAGLRHVAPIIFALASFVTALASFMRPETSARKVYDQHQVDVAALTKNDEHTRAEVEKLRAYLEREAEHNVVPVVGGVVSVETDAGTRPRAPSPVAVIVGPRIAPPPATHPAPPAHVPVPYQSVTGGRSDTW